MAKYTCGGPLVMAALLVAPRASGAQASPAAAQPAAAVDPAGHWDGAIRLPDMDMNVEIDLAKAGANCKGTIGIPHTKDLEGSWEGTLDIQGKLLRLVFKLATQPDGTASAIVVSVDQGNVELPAGAVIQNGAQVKIFVPVVVGTYEGTLKDRQLTGTWSQGPNKWPLTLKRAT